MILSALAVIALLSAIAIIAMQGECQATPRYDAQQSDRPAGRAGVPGAHRFNITGCTDSPACTGNADDALKADDTCNTDQASYRVPDINAIRLR